ncbi:MAG: hypothetical protein ACN6OX_14445 [Pseudomonas sp.]
MNGPVTCASRFTDNRLGKLLKLRTFLQPAASLPRAFLFHGPHDRARQADLGGDATCRMHRKFMAICHGLRLSNAMKKINFKNPLMPDISADNASLIHTIATATAIIAALIAACAVILAQMTSDVQSKHSDSSRAEASQIISKANESAAQLQVKIDTLTQQNQELATKLQAEKQARLKIEARLTPRKLTPQAQEAFKALAAQLSKDKTAPTVLLNIIRNDDEALQYAKQLAVALNKAGAQVQIKQLMLAKEATGLQVVLYDSPGSEQLERAFKEADIAAQISRSAQMPRVNVNDQDTQNIAAYISVYPKDLSLPPDLKQ